MTLDQVSDGRAIVATGVGAAEDDGGSYKVGEAMDLKTRAARLDEGLQVLAGLMTGQAFSFDGQHFKVDAMTLLPPPVQKPRMPLWVVGVWPKPKSTLLVMLVAAAARAEQTGGDDLSKLDIERLMELQGHSH